MKFQKKINELYLDAKKKYPEMNSEEFWDKASVFVDGSYIKNGVLSIKFSVYRKQPNRVVAKLTGFWTPECGGYWHEKVIRVNLDTMEREDGWDDVPDPSRQWIKDFKNKLNS